MEAIRVEGLGKVYKQYPRRWDRLAEWISPALASPPVLHWVLRDISFRIEPGEAVGIIGINGAGKSTLLKIITGTTQPTTGRVHLSGTLAAMLELGMGFHPDFSGRQNVFMAGQLLGLGLDEIERLLPQIEAFAEIGDYIDQPVRVYSSGMQMRLAFSVATARRPDILIVDEALSVGDAYFQHKSFDRIREFRKAGTTLLIVSHDKQAIQSLCDRAILLDGGHLAKEGTPEAVMDFYNALLADRQNQVVKQNVTAEGRVETVSGTGEASIAAVRLLNDRNSSIEVAQVGDEVALEVRLRASAAIPRLVVGYMIKDRLGQPIFGTNTHYLSSPMHDLEPGEEAVVRFHFVAAMGPGTYSVAVALHSTEDHLINNYEWRDLALIFNIVNVGRPTFIGSSWLPPRVEVLRAASEVRSN